MATVLEDCDLLGDTPRSQFVRYVVVGVTTSALYTVLYLALGGLGDLAANVVAMVASTVVANELHRRLTFHAADRTGWLAAQLESGGLAGIALVATSIAVAGISTVVPDASSALEIGVVLAVTGAIGVAKFFALRGWVFSAA